VAKGFLPFVINMPLDDTTLEGEDFVQSSRSMVQASIKGLALEFGCM